MIMITINNIHIIVLTIMMIQSAAAASPVRPATPPHLPTAGLREGLQRCPRPKVDPICPQPRERKTSARSGRGQISILFYSILLYSIIFSSNLFYSILFHSILFYSILFSSGAVAEHGASGGSSSASPGQDREFTKGVLVKGSLAIYVFSLCNSNTSGSVFNAQFENMPNCLTPLF